MTHSSRYDSATIKLQKLHSLPIKQRIDFKICVLSFKTLTINSAAYLATLLNSYKPARTLRSTNNTLLQIPRTKTVTETRAFRCAAPQLWNSLPADITSLHSLDSFHQKLKTFYSAKPMGLVPSSVIICASDSTFRSTIVCITTLYNNNNNNNNDDEQ